MGPSQVSHLEGLFAVPPVGLPPLSHEHPCVVVQRTVPQETLTAVHTPLEEQVWQAPAQSSRVTHPVHWLVAVSHIPAAPVQCLFAVQATQRPLEGAQAGAPGRPAQSLSAVHFAH